MNIPISRLVDLLAPLQLVLGLASMLFLTSCEKFLMIPKPETEIVSASVFEDDATALAAISDVYGQMSNLSFASGGSSAVSFFEGAYADELVVFNANAQSGIAAFYLNNVSATNDIVSSTWGTCYNLIYKTNRIIEGLSSSSAVSLNTRNQVLGEACFVRAFCYFYLINLFGGVPLIETTDYQENSDMPRSSVTQVYDQIILDLVAAKNYLVDDYPSLGRVRPNKGAATAFLARAYLYINKFDQAEAESTEVINNISQYELLGNLNDVFLKDSREAIWQLMPWGGNQKYTYEGQFFILLGPPSFVLLRNDLVQAFEKGDLRRRNWVDSLVSDSGFTTWYFPFKYKETFNNGAGDEYSMVLRIGEQYLIRAEARARQGRWFGEKSAESDINVIRRRAGLPMLTATTSDEILEAIANERRVELFTEWGHRFFDLKRAEKLQKALPAKKLNWDVNDALLPLPQKEILLNKSLVQNPGY